MIKRTLTMPPRFPRFVAILQSPFRPANALYNRRCIVNTMEKRPDWLKVRIPSGETYFEVRRILRSHKLNTICEDAMCPNIAECWGTVSYTHLRAHETPEHL